jgi:hypothetical protein
VNKATDPRSVFLLLGSIFFKKYEKVKKKERSKKEMNL